MGNPLSDGRNTKQRGPLLHLPRGVSDPGSLGLGGASRGRERENSGTLCEPRSYCVTGAVPIDHRLAAELDHLVQPQLPAVDRGGLGLQGNDELLRVLGGGQARLKRERETEAGIGVPGAGLLRGRHTLPCG